MNEQDEHLERRYQPERRAFHKLRWFRERRGGFDRRHRVDGIKTNYEGMI